MFKSGEVGPGAVIMADIQKYGRGQRDKTWQSDAFENLTFSLTADINLWKINSLIDLNRLIALSLYELFKTFDLSPKIKWPNDIMVEDKKISGILIENFFRGHSAKTIIGIGININQRSFQVPRATSMANELEQQFTPKEVLLQFIDILNTVFTKYNGLSSTEIHSDFDNNLWKRNTPNEFITKGNEKVFGTLLRTTDEGSLSIDINGVTKTYRNGEIQY